MNKRLLVNTCIVGIALGMISACTLTPQAVVETASVEAATMQTPQTDKNKTDVPQTESLVIYAPASTSSIPVILAASKLENVDLQLFTNQSQANTLFLRGEANILVSGLSVGLDMYSNEVPVQMIDTYVSGLSYLVTYGKKVTNLSELKGQEIFLPFEGSPIEEVTRFLVEEQGLVWKTDVTPVYSPFESSIEMLKQGTAAAVILPEPNVTLIEGQPDIYVSLSLFDEWNTQTGGSEGYPQVAAFVQSDWAAENSDQIAAFNRALADAVEYVHQNPESAISEVQSFYKLSEDKLSKALSRTRYQFLSGAEMQTAVESYYQIIGKPVDEDVTDFYFISAQ